MPAKKWLVQLSLTLLCLGLGLLLVVQLRTQGDIRQAGGSTDWEYVVSELIEANARLRDEIESLEVELSVLENEERSGVILESLVEEVNRLRIANGLVEVSGPGVAIEIVGPASAPDMHDLINELRNTGAEALALNGRRIVAWSAIGSDGEHVTVDGQPVEAPYMLEAIGDSHTLQVALSRPGGLVRLLQQAHENILITISRREKVTLPVYGHPLRFVYAGPAD
jgi:uncharacterized protein YlxW (UPF0749 family)